MPYHKVYAEEVIILNVTTRGDGSAYNPTRIITEIFLKDGEKIAEHDPAPDTLTPDEVVRFLKYVEQEQDGYTCPTKADIIHWITNGKP
jgi:hypothetical protein